MSVTLAVTVQPRALTPYDDLSSVERQNVRWRAAAKARLDTPTKPEALWIVRELVYWCTLNDARNAYYIVLRMPLGTDAAAASPMPGERVVRLLYEWQDLERHLHMTPVQLRDEVLIPWASEGNRLRASIAYARSGRHAPK